MCKCIKWTIANCMFTSIMQVGYCIIVLNRIKNAFDMRVKFNRLAKYFTVFSFNFADFSCFNVLRLSTC